MSTAPSTEDDTEAIVEAKPPFLRRVRIRGYKSIAFCDVTLEPLTILVGRNATGKSNFVDALAFLRDAARYSLTEAITRRGNMGSLLCRTIDAKQFSIEVETVYLDELTGEQYAQDYALEVLLRPNGGPSRPNERLRMTNLSNQKEFGFISQAGEVHPFGEYPSSIARSHTADDSDILMLNLFGNRSDDHLSSELQRMGFYNFAPDAMRLPRKPNPGWVLDRYGSNLASVIETTRVNDTKSIERVGRYLSVITESVELLGVAKVFDYETVRFRVARNGQGQPLEFNADSMSDGTLRALAALVAAFQIVSHHGSPSLVAIEEPETALHPAAMRALLAAMDEATLRTQILLTTHSPDLLDAEAVKPANIRVVQMIDGQTVIGPVDEASVEIVGRNLDSLGGLERENQLELDLDDLDRQRRLEQSQREPPA